MDRLHRLGQFRSVQVIRYVIQGSVEERLLRLQEKKLAIFEATVGQDDSALGRLTEDDLKFLFA